MKAFGCASGGGWCREVGEVMRQWVNLEYAAVRAGDAAEVVSLPINGDWIVLIWLDLDLGNGFPPAQIPIPIGVAARIKQARPGSG